MSNTDEDVQGLMQTMQCDGVSVSTRKWAAKELADLREHGKTVPVSDAKIAKIIRKAETGLAAHQLASITPQTPRSKVADILSKVDELRGQDVSCKQLGTSKEELRHLWKSLKSRPESEPFLKSTQPTMIGAPKKPAAASP